MYKVLIIEDDPHARGMLNRLLQRQGYETLVATNGIEGLKLFRHHAADVVLVDIFMPEKDGLELILELRKNHRFDNIIAISGGGIMATHHVNILQTAQKFGAKYAFPKPFDREALLKAIATLCQNSGDRSN